MVGQLTDEGASRCDSLGLVFQTAENMDEKYQAEGSFLQKTKTRKKGESVYIGLENVLRT